MFVEREGPTALRADLVRALSLSVNVVEMSGSAGEGRFCAALSAVWNGKMGSVAIVLREVSSHVVRRYVAVDPVDSEERLTSVVTAGISFAESMGFAMDPSEFVSLPDKEMTRRMKIWNNVRKPGKPLDHLEDKSEAEPDHFSADPAPASGAIAATPPETTDGDPFDGWDQDRDPEQAAEDDGKAVLGRLALVRKGGRPDAQTRLRSHF